MQESGEEFLHKRNPQLHTTSPIKRTQERLKKRGEKTSQKPVDKIEAYLDRIKDILNPKPFNDDRDFDRRKRNVDFLKTSLYENVIIKSDDIPESYYENQSRLDREQGRGDIAITDERRKQLSEVIISNQRSSLDNWVNYFTSPYSKSYPMWAKYWAFTGTLKLSTYDKEKHAFAERNKGSVAPFPDLNREALAYVIDSIVKKINKEHISDAEDNPELQLLLQGANFGKLYAYAIEKVTPTEESELINTQGKWIKFPQDCHPMTYIPEGFSKPLIPSLQGHGTGWCTVGETTAKDQLKDGDIYVYYSYNKEGELVIPRVAIRIEDSQIIEVRGTADEQNHDPYIANIVDKKLKQFPDGENYKKKLDNMRQLTEIDRKNTAGEELTKDDLLFLYQLDSIIEGFGYEQDPRIDEILAKRDIKSDISSITDYSKEQISTTGQEALEDGIKFHYGNLDLSSLQFAKILKLPETVHGSVYLDSLRSAKNVEFPKTVRGSIDLHRLQFTRILKLPETVYGSVYLNSLRSAKNVEFPKTVHGHVYLDRLPSAEKQEIRKRYPKLFIR